MKTKTLLSAVAFLTLTLVLLRASTPSNFPMETISGKGFVAIQTALPEFTKKGLNVTQYVIWIRETDASIIVVFDDPQRAPSQRGSSPGKPAFEVELAKPDLKVVRANFAR